MSLCFGACRYLQSGQYVDAGFCYQQFTLFFIPIWNYDQKWCGYIGSQEQYLDIHKAGLVALANSGGESSFNLLSKPPKLPFWDAIGGKLVFGVIFLVLIFLPKGKDT